MIKTKVLESSEDIEKANAIVRQKYEESGYIKKGSTENIDLYNQYKNSFVIGAFVNSVIYGTIALVDGKVGPMPISELFSEELKGISPDFPLERKHFAEVVHFAVDKDIYEKNKGSEDPISLFSARALFRAVFLVAETVKVTHLLAIVNPKHVLFYKTLGFNVFGPNKFYELVEAPAVPLYISLQNLFSNHENGDIKALTPILRSLLEGGNSTETEEISDQTLRIIKSNYGGSY